MTIASAAQEPAEVVGGREAAAPGKGGGRNTGGKSPDKTSRMSTTMWIALLIVYVVWGSTYLAIRIAIESIPPLTSAGIRFFLAGVILLAIIAVRSGPKTIKVTPRELMSAGIVGILLLVVGNGGVTLAERDIGSGLAALLVASVPLWVVLWRRLAGERPKAKTLLGVLIGFAGLAVLVRPGHSAGSQHGYIVGVVLVIIASVSWSFGSVAGKAWLTLPKNPFVASAYEMAVGGVVAIVAALLHHEHLHPGAVTGRSLSALAYLIVFGSLVAFSAYVWLLQSAAPISLVSTYAYVNPVVAVALGALVLSEPVTLAIILGGLIVIVGVAVVIATERQ